MQLTERDERALRSLVAARWLTTSQIARLWFSNVSMTMARRRLRILRRGRYVRSVRENAMAEALHTLGPQGREAVLLPGMTREIKLERTPPVQRAHFIGINDIRIAVLETIGDGTALGFFYACWELQREHWPYAVIPDAVCQVEYFGRTATALFEYDRATEPLSYLVGTKFRRYAAGLDGFPFSHVITVAETQARMKQLRDASTREVADGRFSFLLHSELSAWTVRNLFD